MQIAEIKKGAKKRASNTEHAGWTDDAGDVTRELIDLFVGSRAG